MFLTAPSKLLRALQFAVVAADLDARGVTPSFAVAKAENKIGAATTFL
jgi:hypothetical protein